MENEKKYNNLNEIKTYCNLVKEIREDKRLSFHSELEPYRYILKTLFNYKECDRLKKEFDCIYPISTLEAYEAVNLVKEVGDSINSKLISTIIAAFDPDFNKLLDILKVILKPVLIIDDFDKYLSYCNKLFFKSISCWYFGMVDSGNNDLDQIFNFMKSIYYSNLSYDEFVRNRYNLFAISVLHYYGLSSTDNIKEAIKIVKSNQFNERIELRDCNIFDFFGKCNIRNAKYVLDHFNDFFRKEPVKVIK